MKLGITGLAKTGKTTLFNLLTGAELDTSKYAATLEELHRGIAHVPDPRLDKLADTFHSKKTTYQTIEFHDFAGISFGTERESKLIGDLRDLDAVVHLLRAFEDEELPHPKGSVNPARDAADFQSDLIINDLILVEKRLPRIDSLIQKAKSDELIREKELFLGIKEALEAEKPLREIEFRETEDIMLKGFGFLTAKPLLLVLNVGEEEIGELDSAVDRWSVAQFAKQPGVELSPVCAKLEQEINQLEPEDRGEFMQDLGISEQCTERLLHQAFKLLNLITFFTVSEKEAHSWAVPEGGSALRAAGAVHTDLERGFIRAEVINYNDLLEAGTFAEASHRGALRLEGRDYIVQDGDVINIRFNV